VESCHRARLFTGRSRGARPATNSMMMTTGSSKRANQSLQVFPRLPFAWGDYHKPLDFAPETSEARFLRGCFVAVQRPGLVELPSLLVRLVGVPLSESTDLWSAKVFNVAKREDRLPLRRARQAAALSAIGRAAYAALVETMRASVDRVSTVDLHRRHLPEVIAEYREEAMELDIDGVRRDVADGINQNILTVLLETQAWLRRSRSPLEDLHHIYEEAELGRKDRSRARLAKTIAGRQRRAEWVAEEHPLATPLHYRWGNVRRPLMDLQSAL
jgi:hypothetical protein